MIASGSVGTFCSRITVPASSTSHTDVSLTATSRPTKCVIYRSFLDARGRADLDPLIVAEGDAHSSSKPEPHRRDTPSNGAERKLMLGIGCFRFCPIPLKKSVLKY